MLMIDYEDPLASWSDSDIVLWARKVGHATRPIEKFYLTEVVSPEHPDMVQIDWRYRTPVVTRFNRK